MIRHISLSLGLLAMTSVPALALPEGADDIIPSLQERWGGQIETQALDMNMSGVDEVVYSVSGECGDAGCPWALFSFRDGDWVEVFSGEAERVGFLETHPQGGLLEVDNVTWALHDDGLHLFGDVLSVSMERSPRATDLAAVRSVPGLEDVEQRQIMSWTFDILSGGETVFINASVVNSSMHMLGTWGAPYVIHDAEGVVLHDGHSTDFPRIFRHYEGSGFTVVDVLPAGLGFSRLLIDQ